MDSSNTTQPESADVASPETSPGILLQSTPSKNQRPFLYFLIGVIIVILIAAVSFGAGKRVTSPVTTSTPESVTPTTTSSAPTPDPTAGWRTYITDKYGFSIKWPGDWREVEHSSNFDYTMPFEAPDKSQIQVSVLTNDFHTLNDHLRHQDEVNSTDWEGSPARAIIETKEMTVDGYPAIERTEDWLAAGFTTTATYVAKGKNVYSIVILPYGEGELATQEAAKLYHQILSTFTFIDQAAAPTSSPSVSPQYSAPASWQRYTTQTGLALCLPPKWESNPYGTLVYNRDPGYKPTISTIEQIPYDGSSRREAYFQFWEKEYPNVRQLVSVSEELVNGNSVLTIVPANANEPKTSPEGLTVVWFAAGKLWKAGLSSWGQINTSQAAFLKDFYTLISCSL